MPTIYVKDTEALPKVSPAEFYETPDDVARATVGLIYNLYGDRFKRFVDPGAGTGVWGKAVTSIYPNARTVLGIDCRELERPDSGYTSWCTYDFLKFPQTIERMWDGYTMFIGNPPFSLAEKFIDKAYSSDFMRGKGVVGFLLPSDFIYGQRRMEGLFGRYNLRYIFPYSKRINFIGAGEGNVNNYSFYVFDSRYRYGRPETLWVNHGDMTYRDGSHKVPIFGEIYEQTQVN